MSYLALCSPIDHLVKVGTYGSLKEHKARYTLSHQKDISVAKITLYTPDDVHHIAPILKSLLGVIIPEINKVYISGTRKILRLNETTFIITTEGEARGVLYERLNYNLYNYTAIYDETAALTVLRLDGYYIYNMLSNIIADLSCLPTHINHCALVPMDSTNIICHLNSHDTVFLYLERAYAYEIYTRIARLCLPTGLKIL